MSALGPIQIALVDALEDDTALMNILSGGIHASLAPTDTVRPYLTIGDGSEGFNRMFGGSKHSRTRDILHIWANTRLEVCVIFSELVRILDGEKLTLSSGQQISAKLQLRLILPDEDKRSQHGLVEYECLSLI